MKIVCSQTSTNTHLSPDSFRKLRYFLHGFIIPLKEFTAVSAHLSIMLRMVRSNKISLIIIYILAEYYISKSYCSRQEEIYFLEQSLYEINGGSGKLIINLKYSTLEPTQQKG